MENPSLGKSSANCYWQIWQSERTTTAIWGRSVCLSGQSAVLRGGTTLPCQFWQLTWREMRW